MDIMQGHYFILEYPHPHPLPLPTSNPLTVRTAASERGTQCSVVVG